MSAAEATAGRHSDQPLLSIGQVLARLKNEFPELTNSKLRFLEEQRLVSPSRAASGYRKYSERDIDRVRVILSLQRDRYLPLKVIRTYLDERDAGRTPTLPVSESQRTTTLSAARYSRGDVLSLSGMSADLLAQAVSSGLVPAGDRFDEAAVAMLRTVIQLHKAGIDPRHLRVFLQMAQREAALIQSAVLPLQRRADTAGRAAADELAGSIAENFEIIRRLLLRSALGEPASP